MKRKKWSEHEEQTLLAKYLELSTSGTLSKLKTREKKFKPIADHVNALHHLQDQIRFPFRWTWRDVSIKVQNMRHQYLGVKQKIRVGEGEFNWSDGENHWENFLKYKEVFGDVELEVKGKKLVSKDGDLLGFMDDYDGIDDEEEDADMDENDDRGEGDDGGDGSHNGNDDDGEFGGKKGDERGIGQLVVFKGKKFRGGIGLSLKKRRLGVLGKQVLDLREVIVSREENRRAREFVREKSVVEREKRRKEGEFRRELEQSERLERMDDKEVELDDREMIWARRESKRMSRLEREFDEEQLRRMRMEERREEEEMEWRERMVGLQIEHEKAMMQMHADACQNQMQILGVMARMVCQLFGSTNDVLSGGLGGLPPNLQHPSGLDNGLKPDGNSPSEFL